METMRPRLIGLTGNIGSGKSTVARLLVAKGAALVDADELARQATGDPAVLLAIAQQLGSDLVRGGQLDRAATARRVFADPEARLGLNSIVHPWVRRAMAAQVTTLLASPEPPPVIILDIPLLYENGLEHTVEAVIVVNASLKTRLERVTAGGLLSADEVRARDAAQLPLAEKVARADFVIDNEGDLSQLAAQIDSLWALLRQAA
ncbi:MAG: dephospho-CoA kinase [Truepera sp.]|nr:dephospho-CoA kinase [Truepera sp.]